MLNHKMILKCATAVLLVAVFAVAVLLSSCVPNGTPDDAIFEKLINISREESTVENDDVVASGDYLTIAEVVSITPMNVAVYGTLTDKAVEAGVDSVRISGGVNYSVTQKCIGDYFVISVHLQNPSRSTFAATAMKGEEEIGEMLPFSIPYDSTAEDRLDGKSVSVGRDSRLYFSSYLDDYLGKELYTASQVKAIKATVISRYQAYETRADGSEFGLVYVFIPDVTTVYPEIFTQEDAEKKSESLLTRYEQVVNAVSSTKAFVVDYADIVKEGLGKGDPISKYYRLTDSHITEYGSLLIYEKIMQFVAEKDPDVIPHTIDEFVPKTVHAQGGDYVRLRGLDPLIISEEITIYEPKFEQQAGAAKLRMYNDPDNGDYTLFTTIDSTDIYTGGAERSLVTTDRTPLPNVLIYRDENGILLSKMIAESMDQTLLARCGDYFISMTDANTYRDKVEGKAATDFIMVFVSESSIPTAFASE